MGQILTELLGVDERKFRDYIDRLEHVCMRPGVDIRLGAEIITRARQKIRDLQLDVEDTTSKELFFALRHRLVRDETQLRKKLGLSNEAKELEPNLQKLANAAQKLSSKEHALSLTSAGARRILEAEPPKRTLKLLKYRSLQSVLKRHDARVLYVLAAVFENESWHAQFQSKVRRLNVKDMQCQKGTCIVMPIVWYEKAYKYLAPNGAVMTQDELAVVCVLPIADVRKDGVSVLLLSMMLQAATTISTKSLPYKQQALFQGFDSIIPKIANGEFPELASIHGLKPSWHMVYQLLGQRYLSLQNEEAELEVFDLFWESTEMKLASLVSEMDFWTDTHFLGVVGKASVVSMHVLDVAVALVSGAAFGTQTSEHLSSSLWNELQIRYLKEEVLLRALSNQLSNAAASVIG